MPAWNKEMGLYPQASIYYLCSPESPSKITITLFIQLGLLIHFLKEAANTIKIEQDNTR